jgi:hypothetical protein
VASCKLQHKQKFTNYKPIPQTNIVYGNARPEVNKPRARGLGKSCSPLEVMVRLVKLADTFHLVLAFMLQQLAQENA